MKKNYVVILIMIVTGFVCWNYFFGTFQLNGTIFFSGYREGNKGISLYSIRLSERRKPEIIVESEKGETIYDISLYQNSLLYVSTIESQNTSTIVSCQNGTQEVIVQKKDGSQLFNPVETDDAFYYYDNGFIEGGCIVRLNKTTNQSEKIALVSDADFAIQKDLLLFVRDGLYLYNFKTGEEQRLCEGKYPIWVNEDMLLSKREDGMYTYSLKTGKSTLTFKTTDLMMSAPVLSPDGRYIAYATEYDIGRSRLTILSITGRKLTLPEYEEATGWSFGGFVWTDHFEP